MILRRATLKSAAPNKHMLNPEGPNSVLGAEQKDCDCLLGEERYEHRPVP